MIVTLIQLVILTLCNPTVAFAWGPLTHPILNREAYYKVAPEPFSSWYLIDFMNAGNAPDIIAARTLATNEECFEYAHNMFPHPFDGDPSFGTLMISTANRDRFNRYRVRDEVCAYAWKSHQLADRIGHYPNKGYCESKPLPSIPDWLTQKVKKTGHGMAEFGVDCIMSQNHPFLTTFTSLNFKPALIHETSIEFYNTGLLDLPELMDHYSNTQQKIIPCGEVITWGRSYGSVIQSIKTLINMLPPATKLGLLYYYNDFNNDDEISGYGYNRSVHEVQDFLENLKYESTLQNLEAASTLSVTDVYEEEVPAGDPYYHFFARVGEEAESLGALRVTEEIDDPNPYLTGDHTITFTVELVDENLFREALENVIERETTQPTSDDNQFFANLIKVLYEGQASTFEEVVQQAAAAMDTTPAVITINRPLPKIYFLGEQITVSFEVYDDESGVESCGAGMDGQPVDNGQTLVLDTLGPHSFTVTATNGAGATSFQTVDFEVRYQVEWLPPLTRLSQVDDTYQMQIGRTLPIKFCGAQGQTVADPTIKVNVAGNGGEVTFTAGEGSGSIRWDPTTGEYICNLHTRDYPWLIVGPTYQISVYAGGDGTSLGWLQDKVNLILVN
jgi:hypothetical protein